jgi:hypothetical protein
MSRKQELEWLICFGHELGRYPRCKKGMRKMADYYQSEAEVEGRPAPRGVAN